MPKCLRFGWTPKQTSSPYESNVWKRVYTFNIQALQTMPVRVCQHLFSWKKKTNLNIKLTDECISECTDDR
jgi:hypothetical protein